MHFLSGPVLGSISSTGSLRLQLIGAWGVGVRARQGASRLSSANSFGMLSVSHGNLKPSDPSHFK